MRLVRTTCADRPALAVGEVGPASEYVALDIVNDPLARAAVRDYATRDGARGGTLGDDLVAAVDRRGAITTFGAEVAERTSREARAIDKGEAVVLARSFARALGHIYARERRARDLTQPDVGARIDASQQHLSRLEVGQIDMRISQVVLLALTLEMSPVDLIDEAWREVTRER